MRNIQLGVLLLLLIVTVQSLDFKIEVLQSEQFCFTELISESTPFHLKVTAPHEDFIIRMLLANGTILVTRDRKVVNKRIDSYAALTSHYKFCITNNGTAGLFRVLFHQGMELADIQNIAKQNDADIINRLVDSINDLHVNIRNDNSHSEKANEYVMETQRLISYKTVGFGFLSLAIIILVGLFEYTLIKRMLRNRKIV